MGTCAHLQRASPNIPSTSTIGTMIHPGQSTMERQCTNDWKEDISDLIHEGTTEWKKIKENIFCIEKNHYDSCNCEKWRICLCRVRSIYAKAMKESQGYHDGDRFPSRLLSDCYWRAQIRYYTGNSTRKGIIPWKHLKCQLFGFALDYSDIDDHFKPMYDNERKQCIANGQTDIDKQWEEPTIKLDHEEKEDITDDENDKNHDEGQETKRNCVCWADKIQYILKHYHPSTGTLDIKHHETGESMTHEQLSDYLWHVQKARRCCVDVKRKMCDLFSTESTCCIDAEHCKAFERHYAKVEDRCEDSAHTDKDIQHCLDGIHVYFAHSMIQYDAKSCGCTMKEQKEMDKIDRLQKCRQSSKDVLSLRTKYDESHEETEHKEYPEESKETEPPSSPINKIKYIGKKQDDKWWEDANWDTEYNKEKNDQIYRKLVENMGVFRWQNPHGFEPGANREISHYQPTAKNVKEEVLNNPYYKLPVYAWNQTLRRAKIFASNSVGRAIRTTTGSYYHDQVTGHKEEWKANQPIRVTEIVILKLYTDFDKLQHELKKCFRFENFDDVLEYHSDETQRKAYEQRRNALKTRLEWFYHWRGGLLIVLKKFGTRVSDTNKVLYHGVNSKMLIRPAQTRAFQGPLSTTSSYHVARTFATDKGMVLKISSLFPKLSYCNAFDVSLVSDYPEEQEWLVGFMYVRLLEVSTRKLVDDDDIGNLDRIIQKVPMSSLAREMFFAIHLFKEQILSMSEHLQRMLVQFLKVNRCEVCEEDDELIQKYKDQHKDHRDWKLDGFCKQLCDFAHGNKDPSAFVLPIEVNDNQKNDAKKLTRLSPILWEKFVEFQCDIRRAKFDMISEGLKRFFMERSETEWDSHKEDVRKWVISFEQIVKVYPNVHELIFINEYDLNNEVLMRLIKHIENKENKSKISKISFLYYDDTKDPEKDKANPGYWDDKFKDDKYQQSKVKLEKLEEPWVIKRHKTGQSGYKIRIYNGPKH
eukprot:488390_1